MFVHKLYAHNILRNFTYIIELENKKAICVDPFDGEQVLQYIHQKNLKLDFILNTHQHHDHIKGNAFLQESTKCKVLTDNVKEINSPGVDLEVLRTPGHTNEHVSYVVKVATQSHLFSGDTIFNFGVGNCKNGGEPSVLYETISKKFSHLDDDCLLYTGHDYALNNLEFCLKFFPSLEHTRIYNEMKQGADDFYFTTLGRERSLNPFFNTEKAVIKRSLGLDESTSAKDVFIELRKKRDNW